MTFPLSFPSSFPSSMLKLPNGFKGGEIRDTKTLNLSPNIVSLQVLVDAFALDAFAIELASALFLALEQIHCRYLDILNSHGLLTSDLIAQSVEHR